MRPFARSRRTVGILSPAWTTVRCRLCRGTFCIPSADALTSCADTLTHSGYRDGVGEASALLRMAAEGMRKICPTCRERRAELAAQQAFDLRALHQLASDGGCA